MKFNFDSIDHALLDAVQQDASLSNQALAAQVHVSPATCLRRMQRLRNAGVLHKQVALVNPWALAQATGQPPGLACVVEVSLDRQDADALQHFEDEAVRRPEVQQCWRVSPGPDFVLIVQVLTMADYQSLAQRLFTQQTNVRNVKAFFVTHQAKFGTAIPLPPARPAG